MVKYVAISVLRLTYRRSGLPKWIDLFRDLLKLKRFLLIVLDDARHDIFELMYPRYLSGTLHKALVPPPNTYNWLPKVFSLPEFRHVRVFYASLDIETHVIRIRDFVPEGRSVEAYAVRPKRLKCLKTVLPSEVTEVVKRVGLSGRDIIWYAQSHFPWVCDPELSLMLVQEVLIHDFVPLIP